MESPLDAGRQDPSDRVARHILRSRLIGEILAYFAAERFVEIDTELADFCYSERGYLTMKEH
jgi:hypothetical protein